jgi:hypothetical protein
MAVAGIGIRSWRVTAPGAASAWISDRLDNAGLQEYGPEILTSSRIAAQRGEAAGAVADLTV